MRFRGTGRSAPLAAGVLGVCILAGCANSNLADAPEWTQGAKLPPEHPVARAYPESLYLSTIRVGMGFDIPGARQDAELKAWAAFAQSVRSQVRSEYASSTRSSSRSIGSGRGIDEGVSEWEGRFSSMIEVHTKQILSGLDEPLGWDGYEGARRFHFGFFALERKKAGEQALELASGLQRKLTEIGSLLGDPARPQREKVTFSLEALRRLPELELLRCECRFFGAEPPTAEAIGRLETACAQCIEDGCRSLMAAGSRSELEEALGIYQEALVHWPVSTWEARLADVKRRLPCERCGVSGRCDGCDAQGGLWAICTRCRGTTRCAQACPACGGDGQTTCGWCDGSGRVESACISCDGGRTECPLCRGDGQATVPCPGCGGRGGCYL